MKQAIENALRPKTKERTLFERPVKASADYSAFFTSILKRVRTRTRSMVERATVRPIEAFQFTQSPTQPDFTRAASFLTAE